MKFKHFVRPLIIAAALVQVPAHASGGGMAGATEPTQIMNNIQLIASYAEHIQQTTTQIQQYQTMLKNLVQMTPSQLLDQSAQKLFKDQNMLKAFKDLRRIVVAGQSTSYTLANIDQQFKGMHPGYKAKINFQNAYRDWSDNTLDSVKNALTLVTAHADDFDNEQSMVDELLSKSQTAQGQLQALQAGNAVGVQMVGQLQKLRQLQMAQVQAQNAFISGQQSENDSRKTGLDKVFGTLTGKKVKQTAPQ